MGFDQDRLVVPPWMEDQLLSLDLICSICKSLLECPSTLATCEHIFCHECIVESLKHRDSCPACLVKVSKDSPLEPPPHILLNHLDLIRIKCKYDGCASEPMPLSQLAAHEQSCASNPDGAGPCRKPGGCQMVIRNVEMATHDCVAKLRTQIGSLLAQNSSYLTEITRLRQVVGCLLENSNRNGVIQTYEIDVSGQFPVRKELRPFGALGHLWKLTYTLSSYMRVRLDCCGPLTEVPSDNWSITIRDTILLKLKAAGQEEDKTRELATNLTFKCEQGRVDGWSSSSMGSMEELLPAPGRYSPFTSSNGFITLEVIFPPGCKFTSNNS